MSSGYRIALCNLPDQESARHLASWLVDRALAACVNIVPGIESVYHWQGEVESATEWLLIIKTDDRHWDALQQLITEHHPYEVPEIISLPIDKGLPAYLNWMKDSLDRKPD